MDDQEKVVEVVWFSCEGCDIEGMYAIQPTVKCWDCGSDMISVHPEKVKKEA